MDWEAWLSSASQPPSDSEDRRRELTESQIRDALSAHDALKGRPYRVYAKGSYANNTNVRLNYDVDIAVEYYGFFYSDLCFQLEGHPKTDVGLIDSDDPYTRAEFKADILAALHAAFGKSAVSVGKIAYRVREEKTTLPADVVPCWEYRRYDGLMPNGAAIMHKGSRVFPTSGGYKDNFPKLQLENGKAKNVETGYRYKRMVRAFKKLQTKMLSDGVIDEELPSYFSECLVYNVPNSAFGNSTLTQDMRAVLAHIFNATQPAKDDPQWVHVHKLQYLFHGVFSREKAHSVVDAAWETMGFE